MSKEDIARQIREGLLLLHEPGEPIEIRFFGERRGETFSGYFDDIDKLIAAILQYEGRYTLYQTLNPIEPALLARRYNRLISWAKATTSDEQVTGRRWLPIDTDPKRPSDISSSDEELALAITTADELKAWLKSRGWSPRVAALSGNGAHLLYAIDMPNDDESRDTISRLLELLALRFGHKDNPAHPVTIDTTVYNAARIWKVYGSQACKGDNIPERPHRRAEILSAHPSAGIVTLEMLQAVIAELESRSGAATRLQEPRESKTRESGSQGQNYTLWSGYTAPMIEEALGRAGIGYSKSQSRGSDVYKLDRCLTSSAHLDGAAIILSADGQAAYKCHHNSCKGKEWGDVREMLGFASSRERASQSPQNGSQSALSAPPPPEPIWPDAAIPAALEPAPHGVAMPRPYLLDELIQDITTAPDGLPLWLSAAKERLFIPRAALSIIAAPSSGGKSTFLLNCLSNWLNAAIDTGERFYFYSYEEPRAHIALKLVMMWAGVRLHAEQNFRAYVNYLKHHRGENEQIEQALAAYGQLAGSGRVVIDDAMPFVETLSAQLSAIGARGDTGAVLVDYIQRVPTRENINPRYLQVAYVSQELTRAAVSSELAIITAAQINDEGELREARDIYHQANVVLKLIRERAEGDEGQERSGPLSLFVDKNRAGSRAWSIPLAIDWPTLTITDNQVSTGQAWHKIGGK